MSRRGLVVALTPGILPPRCQASGFGLHESVASLVQSVGIFRVWTDTQHTIWHQSTRLFEFPLYDSSLWVGFDAVVRAQLVGCQTRFNVACVTLPRVVLRSLVFDVRRVASKFSFLMTILGSPLKRWSFLTVSEHNGVFDVAGAAAEFAGAVGDCLD